MDSFISIFLCLLFLLPTYSQLISPCPGLFNYDSTTEETGRWDATLTLTTDAELSGVWVRLILDKPALQVGNWFGEVSTTDNKEYLIKKPGHKLYPNKPFQVKIFVMYDPDGTPPQLVSFRLNAKTVCPEDGATTTESGGVLGQLSTSNPLVSTSKGNLDVSTTNNENENEQFQFSNGFETTGNNQEKGVCGRVARRATPLIVFGQKTTKGQWPWHAAIYHIKGLQLKYTCGGTLISENHILTVAHCVAKPRTNIPVDNKKLIIYLGKYSLQKFGPEVQDAEVSKIFVHPHYSFSNLFNDIAILKLEEPVEITNYVRPVCLWEGSVETQNIINKLGTVVGWGFDQTRKISDLLLQTQMPVVSTIDCIYSNRDFFSQFSFEKNYCAGYRNGTTVCNGDSGGGMVFPKTGTSGQNVVWQIRGIVSLGVALQGEGICDPSHYVIFTDVAKHLNWIKHTLSE